MANVSLDNDKAWVISNPGELEVSPTILEAFIDGQSIIDMNRVYVEDANQAKAFINAYGFDSDSHIDAMIMANIKDRAIAYVQNVLLPFKGIRKIPSKYVNMSIEEYLLDASLAKSNEWPNWSCLLLKTIHCAAHVLYTHNIEAHAEALSTIKNRFLPYISEVGDKKWIGDADCKIPLVAFDIKDQKDFSRTMTKLLHKPGNLAFEIFDRLGIRFVTYDISSVILLLKFLRSRNIIMYANNLPERSRNTLADFAEFKNLYADEESVSISTQKATSRIATIVRSEENPSTHEEFKVLQFTERLMVKLADGRRTFFPYEIQILDEKSWDHSLVGDASHTAYERRQLNRVRLRVFGISPA